MDEIDKEWRICKDEKKIADARPLFEGCVLKLVRIWGESLAHTRLTVDEETGDVDKFLFNVCVKYMITSVLVNLENENRSPSDVKILAKVLFENYEFIHKIAAKVSDDLCLDLLPAKGKGGN